MSLPQLATLIALLFTLGSAVVPGSVAAPANGDVLIFIASAPLWKGANGFDAKENSMSISLDNKIACGEKQFDNDNGWLCKADGTVKAGKHVVAVRFTDNENKPHRLHATLTLLSQDKKFEMPDNPAAGEQFWCVSISMTKIELMPKSDSRCETD